MDLAQLLSHYLMRWEVDNFQVKKNVQLEKLVI